MVGGTVQGACGIGVWQSVDGKGVRDVDRDGGDGSSGDVAGERDHISVCFFGWTRACCGFSMVFMVSSIHPLDLFLSDLSDVSRGG